MASASDGESCFLHCTSVNTDETAVPITAKQLSTAKNAAREFLDLGETKFHAISLRVLATEVSPSQPDFSQIVIHQKCYQHFTHKGVYKAAAKHANATYHQQLTQVSPKKLRKGPPQKTGTNVLPDQCIICQKKHRYRTVRHKRQPMKLLKAETLNGGGLIEAAKQRKDTSLLSKIGPGDCVALEVKYHKDCHLKYIRVLQQSQSEAQLENVENYAVSYTHFCRTVMKDLRTSGTISSLPQLAGELCSIIRAKEDPSVTHFSTSLLKRRLERDFLDIKFHTSMARKGCKVFFPKTMIGQDTESLDDFETVSSSTPLDHGESNHNLYMAATALRHSLSAHISSLPWPMTSLSVSMSQFLAACPLSLIRMVAWATGLSEDPNLQPMDLNCAETEYVKLLSICQDIVSLASAGRVLTPKALSLGLSVKHLTGSKQLGTLLNKLGHSSSYNTVRELETSLARESLSLGNVPEGFHKGDLVTVVWDNNDFIEETRSGSGTTHNTNGIMFQLVRQGPQPQVTPNTQSRTGARTLIPTSNFMEPAYLPPKQAWLHDITPAEYERTMMEWCHLWEWACSQTRWLDIGIPGWTQLNKTLRSSISTSRSHLHYLPVIEAPPTDLTTVHEILQKTLCIADDMDLDCVVAVFDQAIYSKAQQLRLHNPILRDRLVVRLGEFHTVMCFLGVLGKRFGDAGLKDILIESQVVAEGSLPGVLNGHHYNRSIYAHKLLMETLYVFLINGFVQQLDEDEASAYSEMASGFRSSISAAEEFKMLVETPEAKDLYAKFTQYRVDQCSKHPTFNLWSSYIDMVVILLSFIRATRESDWKLHVAVFREMLPWFFAYDRTNYARYGSLYWAEMTALSATHPTVYTEFVHSTGSFTYQRGHHRPFTGIAADQAIEQTVNKDSKTMGGLRGFTMKPSATQRWTAAQSHRAAIYGALNTLTNTGQSFESTSEVEEYLRVQLQSVIEARINPFDPNSHLVSLSSGEVADKRVSEDLSAARSMGESQAKKFLAENLGSKFFEPIKQNKLKTFTKLQSHRKPAVKSDKKLFHRLLVISQQRSVDLRTVMTYSLGEFSYSLANADGSLMKTSKSALMKLVEGDVEGVDVDPQTLVNTALIVDGMAEVQMLKHLPATFGDLATVLLSKLFALGKAYRATRVDFVADTYPLTSIKGDERLRRAKSGSQQVQIYGPNQLLPIKFKSFLANGSNKENLIRFLFTQWSTAKLDTPTQLTLVVGFDQEAHRIVFDDGAAMTTSVEDLACDHEEADTRLLLHGKHASADYDHVIITSVDTDVFVLSLGLATEFVNLYFATGRQHHTRVIDMTKAARCLGLNASALIGLHAFSGCDSVSSFYGKGKKKLYTLMKSHTRFREAFNSLGTSWSVSPSLNSILQEIVCMLYSTNQTKVNEARFELYRLCKATEKTLPPTEDELALHVLRANYQAKIWRSATERLLKAPSPTSHGWKLDGSELTPQWMAQPTAPTDLLQLTYCGCKTGCTSGRCACVKSTLTCTLMCGCSGCGNQGASQEAETEADDTRENDLLQDLVDMENDT